LAAAWLAGVSACALPAPVEPITFAVDDAQLHAQQLRDRVDAAADRMREDSALNLRLVGHADEDNTEEYNEALARRRAEEVRALMVERHPQLSERIEIEGRGEWDPLVRGDDDEAKAQNRRVEFVFFYPRQCEAAWSEEFATCMLGRVSTPPEPEPEPEPEYVVDTEPAPPEVAVPLEPPPEYKGLYGFVGLGWSVSSFDLPRQHLPWGFMAGYVWAPTDNLRLSVGGELDHHAYLGYLFDSASPQCSGACAAPIHLLRVLPEARVGGRAGRMWAHIRVFAGPAIVIRPAFTDAGAGSTPERDYPLTARVRPNLGVGPGFTFAIAKRLMISLDFEVSSDGRFDQGAGVYGGKLSFGRFFGG
jgi:hypothetical protein